MRSVAGFVLVVAIIFFLAYLTGSLHVKPL